MGVQGVPLNIPKCDIINALNHTRGRIRGACKVLDCHPASLYRFINADPELKQILDDLRYSFDENLLDKAEDKIEHALDQMEDLGNGLKAAMFMLNTKGAKRGYLPAEVAAAKEEANHQQHLGLSLEEMQEFAEWRATRKANRNASPQSLEQPGEGSCKCPQDGQAQS